MINSVNLLNNTKMYSNCFNLKRKIDLSQNELWKNNTCYSYPRTNKAFTISNYKIGQSVLTYNNITFKGIEPIDVTDKYNKVIPGKDHLDLPNIHVYEFPDTNLQVFINKDSNVNKDSTVINICIDDTKIEEKSLLMKELCTRLLCKKINFDYGDNIYVSTYNRGFFCLNIDDDLKDSTKLAEICNFIVEPKFTDNNLAIVKQELVEDVKQKNNSSNITNDLEKQLEIIDAKALNDYYKTKMPESEAQAFITTSNEKFDKQIIQLLNTSLHQRFKQHSDNGLNAQNIERSVLYNFNKEENYLDIDFPVQINNYKEQKIYEYLCGLMILQYSPYISEKSFPINIKLGSQLEYKLLNKPLSPYVHFKFYTQDLKNQTAIEAIKLFKLMLSDLKNKDLQNTLDDMKELNKKELKKNIENESNIQNMNTRMLNDRYDMFKYYEIIDSINQDDIKNQIEKLL